MTDTVLFSTVESLFSKKEARVECFIERRWMEIAR